MSEKTVYEFKLPARCSIKSIAIRETNGRDEEIASQAKEAKGAHSSVTEELLRLSIVQVDGQPAGQPFMALDSWNSRTRAFVVSAFRSINGFDDQELPDFLSQGSVLQASVAG